MSGRAVSRGLYAIADAGVLESRGVGLREFCLELRACGVRTVQWRAKELTPQEVLAGAAVLLEVLGGDDCLLIMNDRVDLALLAGFGGVHVGQGDLSVAEVRTVAGPGFVVGVSTHTAEEVSAADGSGADYVAVGPVFATGSKADASAVVGLEGVRMARALTAKPLVAIGGITVESAASVVAAGADACAVISGLLGMGRVREFMEVVGR